jgi:hypothetical protein
MKPLWKTKNHFYIRRYAFIGMGRNHGNTDGETVQISISCPLYDNVRMNRENIKRVLIEEWKCLMGWQYEDN